MTSVLKDAVLGIVNTNKNHIKRCEIIEDGVYDGTSGVTVSFYLHIPQTNTQPKPSPPPASVPYVYTVPPYTGGTVTVNYGTDDVGVTGPKNMEWDSKIGERVN